MKSISFWQSVLLGTSLISHIVFANDTVTVSLKEYPNWFALEAQMEAVNEATISAQTSGRVQSIEVDVNDYVKQGDIIIQLRNTQQQAGVTQAKAGLSRAQAANSDAQSQLKRATPLFEQGSVSKGQYDSIKANAKSAAAQVKASKAVLDQAQEQLSYTQIRAPYSGIVKDRLVQVGETVNPGSPLMTGLSLNQLRAVAHLPQRFINKVNQQTQLNIQHGDTLLSGGKVTIFPFADADSHSFKVRVDINSENAGLFPGMWVKLLVPTDNAQAIRIPLSSIARQGEVSYVYVKHGDVYQLRQVRLGDSHQQNDSLVVDVLAGLKDGDTIAQDAYAIMATQEI
ncbi:efflux RND transporter periplasmic adaptor subunit [Oceaniserpentilla sp. 4NH20-0058]|uniref:efflux RND transporter periplasmic adaptor subunit n=1 Tax=Oceaniserpentilla sp. 4NH20-0058 TaxID=3127660 RepID=UPI003102EF95